VRTPLNVIGGFLGTGKTSAIQHLLGAFGPDEHVAVIVNDFGQASLDADTLGAGGSVSIQEIDGGCVCCTAPEGFSGAVGRLLAEVRPTRILVEPTGLARPADLMDTLARGPHRERLALGPLIVLADPASIRPEVLREQPLLHEQAEAADILVANRVDLADEADLERFDRWAQALWPGPMRIVRTKHGVLDPDLLRWPEGEGTRAVRLRVRRNDGPSTAGFSVQSWIWGQDVVFSRKRIDQLIGRMLRGGLGVRVARAKGVFRTDEGVQRVDVAGGKVHLGLSAYRRDSRFDVIVHGSAPPAGTWPRLTGWLDETICSADELERDRQRIEIAAPGGRRLSVGRADLSALPDGVDDVSVLIPRRHGAAARISALVARYQLPETGEAVVVAADGFVSAPVPVPALLGGLLLHSVDGAALPEDKGGPIRLLIPGDAGPAGPCSNVKGVVRLVFR
jgi:G3E family GTPase